MKTFTMAADDVLCYMDICIAPLQKAIQRRSQRDRQVKRKVFKLRRDADDEASDA